MPAPHFNPHFSRGFCVVQAVILLFWLAMAIMLVVGAPFGKNVPACIASFATLSLDLLATLAFIRCHIQLAKFLAFAGVLPGTIAVLLILSRWL